MPNPTSNPSTLPDDAAPGSARVRLMRRELRTTELAPDAPPLSRVFGKAPAAEHAWIVIWDASRSWPALSMVDLAEAGSGQLTDLSLRREGQLAPLLHAEHAELSIDGRPTSVLLLRTLPHHTPSMKLALSLMRQADHLVVLAGGTTDHEWQQVLEHALPDDGWQGPAWQVAVPVEHPTRAARLRRHAWPAGVRVQAFDWPRAGRSHWSLDLLRRVLLEPVGASPASPVPPAAARPPAAIPLNPMKPAGARTGLDMESRVSRSKPHRPALQRALSPGLARETSQAGSASPAGAAIVSLAASAPAATPATTSSTPAVLPPPGPPDRLHQAACEQLIAVPGVRACAVLRLADAAVLTQRGDAAWLADGAAETGRVARGWRQDPAQPAAAPDALSWTHASRQHLLLRLPDDGRDLALLALADPAATDAAELRWMATVARNALA